MKRSSRTGMLSTFLMCREFQVKKILVQNLFVDLFVMWEAFKQLFFIYSVKEPQQTLAFIFIQIKC